MIKPNYQTLTFILACTVANASFHIKPRIGYDLNFLAITQNNPQAIPQLVLEDPIFKATSTVDSDHTANNTLRTVVASSIYFPANDNSPFYISKDNLDSATFKQLYAGIELSYLDEKARPSSDYQIAPSATAYLLLEDPESSNINSGAYSLSSLNSGGADAGLLITNNGNYLQMGAGARFFQGDIHTGLLFVAMSTVSSSTVGNIDTTSLQDETDGVTKNKPYFAKIDQLMMPYVYAELSTEVGDIASVFIKLQYGQSVTPKFTDVPSNTQMFSGDHEEFARNLSIQQFSATFGMQARVTDLG